MSNLTDLDPARLGDPDYELPMGPRITLGLQHVLAMFASNVTPSIIIAGAAGFAFGSADMVFLIQMAMLFAGVATLFQTIGFGPVGARLPVMQGTSFAFVPIMIGVVKSSGMAALMGSVIVAGIFHAILGSFIGRIRHWFPPLVSGMVITTIGLYLIPVGIRYAAGGAADFQINNPNWGDFSHWSLALVVIIVALGCKFFTRGLTSSAAVLIGLFAGYLVGIATGAVNFGSVGKAAWFAFPMPLKYGLEFNIAAIIGMCLISIVSAIETVGDISAIAKGGAGRESTDKELAGGTYADGLGSALAGIFGGLPNTSFSQNVGIVSMTGVMSRGVVTIGAIFLIICGFIPKIGAVVSSMPIEVLGGGVILMFGMVVSAGVSMLSTVEWSRRNMMILATSMSVGLGLQAVPKSMQHLPDTLGMLMTSGLLPVAVLAVVMNLLLPADAD
ncbi:MAG TPA: uracil permease [Alphaproteobacteria bacterium]|jgi:NCS2 family nucleobase:cation symporter-2|nr:MAG: uracil permease [SAR116 cluster bacterium MED-G05]HBD51507.1 uracil permease [Alphaproteobacteria bacterium]HBP72265.1 uracil permease [Alphaproteobacteria bacterium]HCA15022.1 uracil permease [Alphaproteobacteria bacterium]HCA91730.1 uracil permease [Alphaproteobacteria bacterium]|tara:strand:+ start:2829 stop:4160 length:1332 start_codon:yes stop_codon:yes gene_type:complete